MSVVARPEVSFPVQEFAPPEWGQRVLLNDVTWREYIAIGEALCDRPSLRLTYDRGRLEFMTLSPEHERRKYLFGRLIDILTEELNVPVAGFGSTTFRRDEAERGLEPDQCYYLHHVERVLGVNHLDLTRDPPPDLAIEIDVTHSYMDRMAIYATLGVPEVWRFQSSRLTVFALAGGGNYEEVGTSRTFPRIPVGDLPRFIDLGLSQGDLAMARSFRTWVRELVSGS